MSDFAIDPQEIYFWTACKNGWNRVAGFKCKVGELDCSVALIPTQPVTLVFSEWESGARIKAIPLSFLDVLMSDTKEKALDLINENAHYILKIVEANGIEKMKEQSLKSKREFELKFGAMPEVEIINEV